jgi:hypothetical protein
MDVVYRRIEVRSQRFGIEVARRSVDAPGGEAGGVVPAEPSSRTREAE